MREICTSGTVRGVPGNRHSYRGDNLMAVEIVNPIEHPDWDALVLAHPNCSFFHSSAWARVLQEAYGYKPLYFTIFDGDAISACLPVMEVSSFITGKRGVSLPFSDRCEPLADHALQFDALLSHAKEYGKKAGWKYLELRGGTAFLSGAEPSSTYLGHTLDLTIGEIGLFAALRDSTRRNTKKAEKEGVEVTVSDTMDAVTAFYDLNQVTRKHHGLPPQPFNFFRAIHEHVLSRGLGFVVLASYRSTPIAASVFLQSGRKALYKYGASALEHRELRANNLVMWKAIERLSKRGFESLCFGRTDIGHDGLKQFKTGWGAQENHIHYYRHDLRQNKFVTQQQPANGFSKMIFGKLPVPVLNAIGSLAYRHMG